MNRHKKIAVIGGGLGGLAAACTLAARGYSVNLFEKNSWLGGKAALLEAEGFRFDMGPTILTLPRVLERIFAEASQSLSEQIELIRLNPQWRCFFSDTSILDLVEDPQSMAVNLDRFTSNKLDSDGYKKFLGVSSKLHTISDRFFFWKSVEDLRDTIDVKKNFDLNTLKDVLSLRMGYSVAQTVRKHIKDKKVAQMIDHFVQYVGSSPLSSPAVLCSIAHMQTHDGIWYPKGGTHSVACGLEKLARGLGVAIHTNQEIKRIQVIERCVRGIEMADGEMIEYSAVVSNMDALRTYKELFTDGDIQPFKWRRDEPACSGVVLYLGLKKRYDHLLHHNFVFSENPEDEFASIYKKGEPAPDPTCYIAAPAQTDPSVAPPGGEALYVLVHTPYLRSHHNWRELFPKYRRIILEKLARSAGMEDIDNRIVFESNLTPQDIHDRYKVLNGAIYGLSSHGKFLGAFKPGNRSRNVSGLYLAGGAAHPGPGMPMVMMSGWIAADSLDHDLTDSAN